MAMENSATLSNDAGKEISPSSQEDLTSSGLTVAQVRSDEPDSKTENGALDWKPKDGADPEGDFLDAEAVAGYANSSVGPVDANSLVSGGLGIFAEGLNGNEDDGESIESFDSALERIATASAGDPSSPLGPSSPLFEPADSLQKNALQKLNIWDSGVPSLDTTLLDNVSPAEFRAHVAQLAEAQGLSIESEDVENILYVLLPLVGRGQKGKDASKDDAEGVSASVDNRNSDDGVETIKQDSSSSQAVSNGSDITNNALDSSPAKACQSQESNVVNMTNNGDASEHDVSEQAVKSTEQEPEIIEGDVMNESTINTNVENVDAESFQETRTLDDNEVAMSGASVSGSDLLEPQALLESHVEGYENEAAELGHLEGDSLTEAVEVDDVQKSELESASEDKALVNLDTADETVLEHAEASSDSKEVSSETVLEHTEALVDLNKGSDEMVLEHSEAPEEMSDDVVLEHAEALLGLKEVNNDIACNEREPRELEQSPPGEESDGVAVEVLTGDECLEGNLVETDLEASATKEQLPSEVLGRREFEINISSAEPSISGDFEQNASDSTSTEQGTQNVSLSRSEVKKDTDLSEPESDELSDGDAHKQETLGIVEKGQVSINESHASVATVMDSKASGNDASSLGGAGPTLPARPPAGLGRSVPSLEHAPRAAQRSSAVSASPRQLAVANEENHSSTDVSEGGEDAQEKLQMIRVKFLRLAQRLGQSAHNVVVAQVLYRLGLAEQLRGGRGTGRTGAFSFERASVLAEEQEVAGSDDLEFGCTIMVLGKSGVGKSATINCLFDELKSGTNAYSPATNKVQEIVGTVHGIKLRVIDTPGLLMSFADQRRNERIMASVKQFIKKSPPDIVLYFDRLDMQSRDYGDLPLLRTITNTFGSAVWFNAIVVLTHASSAPPDGANGVPVSYEMFVAQRSHVVQQTIRQAAGDMRLMNPVSLVENHAACRRNRAGERVLPNGQVWKPQLLLLCFASKILAEANSLLKLQDNSPAKPFGVRSRVPPLPFLLSSLLQSRAQLKLPDEQIGSEDESEDESEEDADSDGEEYDDLPPFRRLTKDELKLLDKDQTKIYAEELELRERLFMKQQLKDERARKKELKRRLAELPKEAAQFAAEEEENASAAVPVPMPDMALPPSFDSDNPAHRYRYLDTANQWLVRPVLETHGWDHDSGYDGLNAEKIFIISNKIPISVSGQVTKDKKEANLQMECATSFKNGEGKVTQAGLDIQTIGKDLAYTLRSETRFNNFKRNKTTCGLAVTLLGDTVAAGMKIEDRLLVGKRVKLLFNGGALTGRRDVAYGGSLEVTIRDKDYPIGQFLSTFGLSVMDWHGDLAIGGNLQVQCKIGKTTVITRGNLNNRRAGQVSIRVSSSEQLQMTLIGLIPLLRTFINNRILKSN